jgi:hypothetical protein
MPHRKIVRRSCAVLLLAAFAIAVAASAAQQRRVQPPRAVRLYVFVAHPKGTLVWDVGAIPDTAFKKERCHF